MAAKLEKAYDIAKFQRSFLIKHADSDQEEKEGIAFTIKVKNKCLKSWYDLTATKRPEGEVKLVDVINRFLVELHVTPLKENCPRIENHARALSSLAKSLLSGKRGRHYTACANLFRRINVLKSEVVESQDLHDARKTVEKLRAQNIQLSEQNKCIMEVTERCEQLSESLKTINDEKCKSVQELEEQVSKVAELEQSNKKLLQLVSNLEQLHGNDSNRGKPFSEVGQRQQHRMLKELKTKSEKSLWFAKTFGMDISFIEFEDQTGQHHKVKYSSAGDSNPKPYAELSQEEKDVVKQVTFITDSFCIGEAAYHELTMGESGTDLPRSYLIKQCKNDLNKLVQISRTPGQAEGAQLDFETELAGVLRNKIEKGEIQVENSEKVKVKISGDGANMTRQTSFVVISFSIVDSDDVMSSKGNHTIAVIKGQESYELLRCSCSELFESINKITREGKIKVDGQDIMIDMFLGGDYKFLLEICGMKGATSDHSCLWCKLHKKHRHDMTKPENYYWEIPLVRSLEDIMDSARQQIFSCVHPPLLNIRLQNIFPDELHLMLRVTDVLLNNLILGALSLDAKDNHDKRPNQRTAVHIDALLCAIRGCGVTFSIWEKMNANGSGSGTYDFTSLMGPDKRVLLEKLGQKLEINSDAVKQSIRPSVIKLWDDFNDLCHILTSKSVDSAKVDEYFQKAKSWIQLFTSLEGIGDGYTKKKVTPYMHLMVYHIPYFMRKHAGIRNFSGQGVEKKNDDCRKIHLFKSNKWDAATDVLRASKRLENLEECRRAPRSYSKQNAEYWSTTIKESRAAKRQSLKTPENNGNNQETELDAVRNFSPPEIRAKLKEMGFPTKVRNVKRLQELYQMAIRSVSGC